LTGYPLPALSADSCPRFNFDEPGEARPKLMQKSQNPWITICPGIKRQTVTNGKSMYQMRAHLDAGSQMPEHHHPHEQIVHILKGRMKLIVGGEAHELSVGDSYYLAGNVPHAVETIEDTDVLDTFSPPRDEYLAIDEANRRRTS
jgi:quercetin dioxygenase-like cupin family protein